MLLRDPLAVFQSIPMTIDLCGVLKTVDTNNVVFEHLVDELEDHEIALWKITGSWPEKQSTLLWDPNCSFSSKFKSNHLLLANLICCWCQWECSIKFNFHQPSEARHICQWHHQTFLASGWAGCPWIASLANCQLIHVSHVHALGGLHCDFFQQILANLIWTSPMLLWMPVLPILDGWVGCWMLAMVRNWQHARTCDTVDMHDASTHATSDEEMSARNEMSRKGASLRNYK